MRLGLTNILEMRLGLTNILDMRLGLTNILEIRLGLTNILEMRLGLTNILLNEARLDQYLGNEARLDQYLWNETRLEPHHHAKLHSNCCFCLQLPLEAGSSIDITFCNIIQDYATSNPRQRAGYSSEVILKMVEEALQLSESFNRGWRVWDPQKTF